MGLSKFKTQIAFSLMKSGKEIFKKRGRPSFGSVEVEYKKKERTGNASAPIPQKNICLDKVGHFSACSDKRMTCKRPGCNGKIFMHCMKCDVHLCCSKNKNCFYIFHNE